MRAEASGVAIYQISMTSSWLLATARDTVSVASVMQTEDHRFLLADSVIIGCEHRVEAVRDQACFAAMALMATVAFLLPAPRRALCLGLGAGFVPQFLRARGVETDVVEHDAAVIKMAEDHFLFGVTPPPAGAGTSMANRGGSVLHHDALDFVANAHDRRHVSGVAYDVVLSDLWTGGNEGRALLRPFFASVRSHLLRPNGTFAMNILAYADGPHFALARRTVHTLRAVFRHVLVFDELDPAEAGAEAVAGADPDPSNLLLLASDAPIRLDAGAAVDEKQEEEEDEEEAPNSMGHLFAHFQQWQPPRLREAAHGPLDSEAVLETAEDWAELLQERTAANQAMRSQQRALLPDAAWRLVEELVHEAEETPPRRMPRAPPSVVRRRDPHPHVQPQDPGRPKEELR